MPRLCKDCGLWRCSHCSQCKPAIEYNKARSEKTGLRSRCKNCDAIERKIHRNPDKDRERFLKRYYDPKNLEKMRAKLRERYAKNSEKLRTIRQQPEMKEKLRQRRLRYLQNGGRQKFRELNRTRKHRIRHNVRWLLHKAISDGVIPKATQFNCCYCGQNAVHYHHPLEYKYEFRFCVIPVCLSCHYQRHLKYRITTMKLVCDYT